MTVVQQTLQVSELLETMLLNLSTSDILCGAQLVSKFWRECVHGSIKLKKKCFLLGNVLSEEDTDSRLYVDISCPAYSKYLKERHYRTSFSFKRLVPSQEITPANFRQAFVSSPLTTYMYYQLAVETYILKMRSWDQIQFQNCWDKLCINSGRAEFSASCSLLDTSCLHPHLCRHWKEKNSVIWGGYGHHIVFWLGYNYSDARYLFKQIRTFLYATIEALSSTIHTPIWQLTVPATKKLTVALRLPALRSDTENYLEYPTTTHRDSGITVCDLLRLLVLMIKSALEDHDENDFHGFLTTICQYEAEDTEYKVWMERYAKEMELISKSITTLEEILTKQGYNVDAETRESN